MKHNNIWNYIKKISLIILVCCIALAAASIGLKRTEGIQFRSWLSILIYFAGMYGIPVSLLSMILSSLSEKKTDNGRGVLANFGILLSTVLLIFILLIVTGYTLLAGSSLWGREEKVAGNIIRETNHIWLDSDVYFAYYKADFIFKSPCSYNDINVVQAILEERYHEKFNLQSTEEHMGGTIFEVDAKDFSGDVFHMLAVQKGLSPQYIDNYSDIRANRRALEYIGDSSEWDIKAGENESAKLVSGLEIVCQSKEEARDCAAYVAGMIEYVLEDSFFKDHASGFCIVYSEDNDNTEKIAFPFGLNQYENTPYDYYADEENVYHDLLEKYADRRELSIKIEAEAAAVKMEQMQEAITEEEAEKEWQPVMTDEDGMLTPEGAYEKLYEEVFKPQGDEYTCTYNAKGNFYGILGEETETIDGNEITTMRTVVYDRISKNNKCQLFVYYKEYYNETGNYKTAILNFYAVDMSTGKIIEGNKMAWQEVASKEYQEATGDK